MGTGAKSARIHRHRPASDQGPLLTTTLVSVETAQVLAQFVLECPINAVAPTAETLAAVVTDLVLPHDPLTRGMVRHTMTRYGTFSSASSPPVRSVFVSRTLQHPGAGRKCPTREIAHTDRITRGYPYTPSRSATPHHSRDTTLPNHPRDGHADEGRGTTLCVFAYRSLCRRCSLSGTNCCLCDFSRTPGLQSLAPACRRLLMQEPLAGSPRFATEIEHRYETHTTTEPVRYATLRAAWDDAIHPPLVYDVNPDGEVSIPQHAPPFGDGARPVDASHTVYPRRQSRPLDLCLALTR